MIRDLVTNAVPEPIRARGATVIRNLNDAPAELRQRGKAARDWVRSRVTQARNDGEERLWTLQLHALEGAGKFVRRVETLPALERVGSAASDVLENLEREATRPPIANYNDLGVRNIIPELRELGLVGLLKVKRAEEAGKQRKTILDAIDREMERLSR